MYGNHEGQHEHRFQFVDVSDTMKFVWGLAQTPKFCEVGQNLFISRCLFKRLEEGHTHGTLDILVFDMTIEDWDGIKGRS